MTEYISVLIAIIGCFVGLAGFLSGRDKKVYGNGKWQGSVDTKLDTIQRGIDSVGPEIKCILLTLEKHGERITVTEESAKSAHKRIDELLKGS